MMRMRGKGRKPNGTFHQDGAVKNIGQLRKSESTYSNAPYRNPVPVLRPELVEG